VFGKFCSYVMQLRKLKYLTILFHIHIWQIKIQDIPKALPFLRGGCGSAGKIFQKNPDPLFRKYTQFENIKKATL
jgi:hypothetical protein